MSCINCEDDPIRDAYYRWSNADVEIVACREHWLQIREALNNAQSQKESSTAYVDNFS